MSNAARLKRLILSDGPLILDGGLATELEAQGAELQVIQKPYDNRVQV